MITDFDTSYVCNIDHQWVNLNSRNSITEYHGLPARPISAVTAANAPTSVQRQATHFIERLEDLLKRPKGGFRQTLHFDAPTRVQRSVLTRSRRELSNAYLLAKIGFDTAENVPLKRLPKNSQIIMLENK